MATRSETLPPITTQPTFASAAERQDYWFSIAEIQEIDSVMRRYAKVEKKVWTLLDATNEPGLCSDRVCVTDGKDNIYLRKLRTDRNNTIAYEVEGYGSAATFSGMISQFSSQMSVIYFRDLRQRRQEHDARYS